MPHPRNLPIDAFDYPLPDHRIARFPLAERDASKLLVYRGRQISAFTYAQLPELLPAGSTLVFNDTRVIEARLLFSKESGGVIEIFTLEPGDAYVSMEIALSQQGSVEWNCLVGGASKWKPHYRPKKIIPNGNEYLQLEAEMTGRTSDAFRIRFSWTPSHLTFPEVLHLAGQVPLPPYLKREATAEDESSYQTVYARHKGSVAAPTAGLHFTERIFSGLALRGIEARYLTLHVGAGTFRPVKSETIAGHEMHSEYIDVKRELIQSLKDTRGPVYAVGTTSLRTLESLYWMGIQCMRSPDIVQEKLTVLQWDPYDAEDPGIPREEALSHLLTWMNNRNLGRLITRTQILVAPGYRFRIINGLITNFHQPRSTLLLLIAAIVGEDWKRIYQYALDHDFRFLSYGDGCLLEIE